MHCNDVHCSKVECSAVLCSAVKCSLCDKAETITRQLSLLVLLLSYIRANPYNLKGDSQNIPIMYQDQDTTSVAQPSAYYVSFSKVYIYTHITFGMALIKILVVFTT